MQGLHNQQQQLAALLSAALPKKNEHSKPPQASSTTTSPASSSTDSSLTLSDEEESSRVAALASLHRAIIYPPNSILVTHSASFLAQGLYELLSDKSYLVRQSAATAYGALCSVLCSVPIATNGRQNHAVLGGFVDRFMGWALPLLNHIGIGTAELALESLKEFLNVGDIGSLERYAFPILKSCQDLLEDERTSVTLLRRLLGVLTLIALKYFRCFQPHFVDIVDLLLGWAMVPGIAESDWRAIMDSFLQFRKHWANNMQFSLGLLSKFLGDIDVLLQDGSPDTQQHFQRLIALLSCFSTVLQSVASGLLEIYMLEQISEPLCKMVPRLLGSLSMIGRKFGWSTWIEDSWRCLTLLAEILSERFSIFYPAAADILFQSLEMETVVQNIGNRRVTPFQVHGVLKTNLQILSLQNLGLLPSSVQKILQFGGPISRLRLHPNQLVTGSAAATYVFLLQHVNHVVVERTLDSLLEELELLKNKLDNTCIKGSMVDMIKVPYSCTKSELLALIQFDLKVILISVSLVGSANMTGKLKSNALFLTRLKKLASFVIEKFHPFSIPIQHFVELQVIVLKTLERLTEIEFTIAGTKDVTTSKEDFSKNGNSMAIFGFLKKYVVLLVKSLDSNSPLSVKLEALQWIHKFCGNLITHYENLKVTPSPCEVSGFAEIMQDLLFSVLDAASDKEPKVRCLVASVLNLLLQAKLIHATHFPSVAGVALDKLGDPDKAIRSTFIRLLSYILPITVYMYGLSDFYTVTARSFGAAGYNCQTKWKWKQVFALKQLPQQLQSQQLVSILSYLSQRWKSPLSLWIQRLICMCQNTKVNASLQPEDSGFMDADALWQNIKVEEDIIGRECSVNILAGAWWAINEAARYCIFTRLRTNLGGPTQTFAALERMLLDIAHVLQLDTEQSDGNLNIISSSYGHLLPMRLLVDFVEALKKNVYNAYEGSVVLPRPTRQSSLFFRSNKKVCEEWFSRISEPMTRAGLALQYHSATIHYCAVRLEDISNLVSSNISDKARGQVNESMQSSADRFAIEIFRVVRQMALALCRNHEPEALTGLQKWATISFSPMLLEECSCSDKGILQKFSWMTGLVYEAQGQYEKAAAHFIHLMQTEDSLSSMGSDGVQFAIARIIESYTAISDWKSLESWLLELQALRSKHAGKSYSGALTTAGNDITSIQALARFDEGDLQASWACLDLTPKSSSELTLDPKLALQRSEQMFLQAMLFHREGKVDKVSYELQKSKSLLEESLSVLPLDGLMEAVPQINHLYCIHAFEENREYVGIQDKCMLPLLGSYVQASDTPINHGHQDCSLWLKVLRVFQTAQPTSATTLMLSNKLLSLARKQRNVLLANRLSSYLEVHASKCPVKDVCDYLITSLRYEGILLVRSKDKEDALINLWSFLSPLMTSTSLVTFDSFDNIIKAKACLKFSNWLRQAYSYVRFEDIVAAIKADFSITDPSSPSGWPTLLSVDYLRTEPSISSVVEGIVGTATKLSTYLCPAMGKSWISYASWCYSQGLKHLSANHKPLISSFSYPHALATEILPQSLRLTEEELSKVNDIVWQLLKNASCLEAPYDFAKCSDVSSESLRPEDHMQPLVDQITDTIETTAGATDAENNTCEGLSSILTSQLRKCVACANVVVDDQTELSYIGELLKIWWSLRRRRVYLFGHAAQAFINYLSYSSVKCSEGQLTSLNSGSRYKSASYSLRATLYVLNILLNYGVELKDTLEPALSTIPLLPWQEIIPQLFARLSTHPEQTIRQLLESLLLMLAKVAPWSIVYPTLVDANTHEYEPSGELQRILACLNKSYPLLVQDAQLIIKELENVTVLWEELWLSTLQDLHADVVRRINLLKEEAARTAENLSLSHGEKNKINAAKYSAMMAPVIVVLERRLVSTSRKPETSHEMWFHKEFEDQIKSAILNFKTPVSAAALGDIWRSFESIAASLSSYQRKSSISLGEVAPQLSQLSSSEAPMPGLEKYTTLSDLDGSLANTNSGVVTIASFSEQFTIVSTKTRPKKLVLLGSDGQKYTYLLKGREDLRLDARIMQLLQAINGFLLSTSATEIQPVGVRYYSVTPISGRAGLIQWVDNVTSIYSVFKSWQNRVQQAPLSGSSVGNAKQAFPPPVPRPIDMFYSKIIPALKEKGIRRVISRRDWPQEVKRKVLLDLMKEAPKQLLHQELWCASEGFKAFRSKLKRYSGSLAAMSIIGHILGLGDRHLDNILIDFCSGDIVHIDYNVCFDKGQRLKVPEIVPFRLTQTIEAALGLTGIEGSFRSNCETVFGVLKRNKDIILMLLEAFVWDPLVEWTRGDFHDDAAIVGEERKGMELAVSLSLFASRVQEIRVPLQEHHDLLLASLPAIEDALEGFLNILNRYEVVSTAYHRADQERANLLLHETSVKSNVAETVNNSEKIRASMEIQAREFAQALTIVREKGQELSTWMEQHGRIIDALRSDSVPETKGWNWLTGGEESLTLTSAVLLTGVPLTVVPEPTQAQCSDIDREVSISIGELNHGFSSAVSSLQSYSLALQRILPADYLTTSPVHAWAQLLQLSVNSVSSDHLSLARGKAGDLISQVHVDRFNAVQSKYDELSVKVSKYAGKIKEMEEEHAELLNSIGPEDESKAKHRFLSGFLRYMRSYDLMWKEGTTALGSLETEMPENVKLQEIKVKKAKFLSVLCLAIVNLYGDIKHMILDFVNHSGGEIPDSRTQSEHRYVFGEIEEQIEKCLLITDFLNELGQHIKGDIQDFGVYLFIENWASNFHNCLSCCKGFVQNMIEFVLPEVINCFISSNSEVMDVFGSLSHIKGSIDTALEQLLEVELERSALVELEQNYFLKVGQITEQQLALEEAAVKGRDHLSWEEAEELASQEEACKEELDKLHQTWNQKDLRTTTLLQKEANIARALEGSQSSLLSFVSIEEIGESHVSSGRSLLALLMQPFSELESTDRALMLLSDRPMESTMRGTSQIGDLVNSGCPTSEYIWKFPAILPSHAFFIWKVSLIDLFLEFCANNASSFVDKKLGIDHIVHVLSRKLEFRLQYYIGQYLKERVAPVLLARLDKENEFLKHLTELKEFPFDPKRDLGSAIKGVQRMFEEYCNAHETAKSARSATSLLERQISDLKDGLYKTVLEVIRMEWMHDTNLKPLQNNRLVCNEFFRLDDTLYPSILNINRRNVLECMQTSITQITRSLDILQGCEQNSVTAEGQLERAMIWACGGPSTIAGGNNAVRSAGIPPEFHDHLKRRKQQLWETREKASEIMKICLSVLKFEASRDGIYINSEEFHPSRSGGDSTIWQQTYSNILTKLDVSYHSFTRSEQEWRLIQNNMEDASSGLNSASSELHMASDRVKAASGDLQSTLLAMRDCAYEASVALSAFAGIIKGHTALTSECGSMLEEVLAITEDLHDVHTLGKEAAGLHFSLMDDLSKVNAILLPLDSMLSKDVTAMTNAMANEQETKMEISPIHGQAIFQSYYVRMKDTCRAFKPFVPSLTSSIIGLYSILTRLARTASFHAGNLHKALEGLGEIQEEGSQENDMSRSGMPVPDPVYDDGENEIFVKPNRENEEHLDNCASPFEDEEWLSPPESIMSCSSDSSVTSTETHLTDRLDNSYLTDFVMPNVKSCADLQTQTSSRNIQESSVEKLVYSNESSSSNQDRDDDDADGPTHIISQVQTEPAPRTARGKNGYAMLILKRIEMKLDGLDTNNRDMNIAEQVDFLLKQATNVDNLCNMYEGWTPWI